MDGGAYAGKTEEGTVQGEEMRKMWFREKRGEGLCFQYNWAWTF